MKHHTWHMSKIKTGGFLALIVMTGLFSGWISTAFATTNAFTNPTPEQLKLLQATDENRGVKYQVWNIDLNNDGYPEMLVKSNTCTAGVGESFMMIANKAGYQKTRYALPDWRDKIYVLKTSANGMRQLQFDNRAVTFSFGKNQYGFYTFDPINTVTPQEVTLAKQQKNHLAAALRVYNNWNKTTYQYALKNMPETAEVYDLSSAQDDSGSKKLYIFETPSECEECENDGAQSGEKISVVAQTGNSFVCVASYNIFGKLYVLKSHKNDWPVLYIAGTSNTWEMGKEGYECRGPCRPCSEGE